MRSSAVIAMPSCAVFKFFFEWASFCFIFPGRSRSKKKKEKEKKSHQLPEPRQARGEKAPVALSPLDCDGTPCQPQRF